MAEWQAATVEDTKKNKNKALARRNTLFASVDKVSHNAEQNKQNRTHATGKQ